MAVWFANVDVLSWFAAITQPLLMLLGAVVSLQEEWAKKHKGMVLSFFVILGIGGFSATLAQSNQSTREAAEASAKLANLSSATNEITRITTLNTDLQGQLLDASETITSLTRQNISNVTGGNSFCYLAFGREDQGFNFVVSQRGQFPLHSVLAQVTDYRRVKAIMSGAEKGGIFQNIQIGDLSVKDVRPLFGYPYPPSDVTSQNFDVYFRALNGTWLESARLRKLTAHGCRRLGSSE